MGERETIISRAADEAIRRARLLFQPKAGAASPSASGPVPPSPSDATKFLNGAATPAFAQVKDSDLATTDITTNNVSTSKHGFTPKLPNDATKYLDGTGAYSVPAGGGASFPGSLPTFPTLTTGGASIVGRFSAEPSVSTITKDADGRVSNLTDSTGSWGSALTASTNARPRWMKYAFNRCRPGFVFDGAAQKLVAAGTKTVAQPLTVIAVLQNWKGGANNNNVFRDSGGGPVLYHSAGTDWAIYAGSVVNSTSLMTQTTEAMPDGLIAAPCVAVAVFNNASSLVGNNGTEVTGTAGTTGISGTMYVGGDSTTSFMHGVLYELLFISGALNSTDRAALVTYYTQACSVGA